MPLFTLPTRPSSPNVAQPIELTTDLHVSAGTVYFSTNLNWLFREFGFGGLQNLNNEGTLWASGAGAILFLAQNYNSIVNSGTAVAEATDGTARTFYITSTFQTGITNSGSIYAVAAGDGVAIAIEHWSQSGTINNSGTIGARSNSARALVLMNGGSVINGAAGAILAEGPGATAIYLGRGHYQVPGQPPAAVDILNHGHIEALSDDPSRPSVALSLDHSLGESMVVDNHGVIRADIAIVSFFSGTGAKNGIETITNHSGGLIDGEIYLDAGGDRLVNNGEIIGYVDMGEDGDLFDNRLGQHVGNAEMGWGDDYYRGGTGIDAATGNRGDDSLDGGAGNDLLLGGWGNDSLRGESGNDGLYGEGGNDLIFTIDGDLVVAGEGDDRVALGDYRFASVAGGAGRDVLALPADSRILDLTAALGTDRISGFEEIELAANGRVIIRQADVAAISGGSTLTISGSVGGTVDLSGSWAQGANQVVGGVLYAAYTSAGSTVLVEQGLTVNLGSTPPGATGLDAVSGGASAPTPGQVEGADLTPNVTVSEGYYLTSDLEIYAAETWTSATGFLLYADDPSLTLINRGTMSVTGTAAGATAISASIFSVQNYGLISSSAFGGTGQLQDHKNSFSTYGLWNMVTNGQGNAYGFRSGSYIWSFLNSGTIQVETDQAMAVGHLNYGMPYAENSGTITATSSHFIAVGFYAHNGGAFVNSGTIQATGSWGAYGFGSSTHVVSLTNSGTIRAHATEAGREGVAVDIFAALGEQNIRNSGLIEGEVAIRSTISGNTGGNVWLDNSGTINGRIELSATAAGVAEREDFVVNRGTINGVVSLGAGRDIYDGTFGSQVGAIRGEAGNDLLIGTAGRDTLDGGAGDDVLVGRGGDTLTGGTGSDTFIYTGVGGLAEVITDFVGGSDRIDLRQLAPSSVSINGSVITATTSQGTLSIQVTGSVSLSDIVTASQATYAGSAGNDWLIAGGIAATLTGGDGVDFLIGSAGNDRLDGGVGGSIGSGERADLMWGGAGDDVYIVDSTEDRVIENAGGGYDTIELTTNANINLPDFVERMIGGSGYGNYLDNTMIGSAELNFLEGRNGNDSVHGLGGNDFLSGGLGTDLLAGGQGRDEFFGTAAELNGDTIVDFAPGDRIRISDGNFDTFTFSLNGNVLNFSGGSITLSNGPTVAITMIRSWQGVELVAAPHNPNTDVSGDSISEIFWRHMDGTIGYWRGYSNGTFQVIPETVVAVSNGWQVAGNGDFDGDGYDDILWRGQNGEVGTWLTDYVGAFLTFAYDPVEQAPVVPLSWQITSVGDFNGDNRDDILWRNSDGTVGTWSGQADGTFVANNAAVFNVSTDWQIAATGDFNGDGQDDILWRHDSGTIADWLAGANGAFFPNFASLVGITSDWHIIGTGDFNGDNRHDILWRHDSGTVANWTANADGTFSPNFASLIIITNDWQVAAIGDYNGDGSDDILWRHDSGTVANWLANSDATFTVNNASFVSIPNDWQVQAPEILIL